jgi:glycerate-2-kinase
LQPLFIRWSAVNGHALPIKRIADQDREDALGLDAEAYLNNNDTTAFFAATGDLVLTAPTLTNFNDIRVILVDQA